MSEGEAKAMRDKGDKKQPGAGHDPPPMGKVVQMGLTSAQRALVVSEPLVAQVAVRAVLGRYGQILPSDEMLAASKAGVVAAARSHDPCKGPFGRWALHHAIFAILMAARGEGRWAKVMDRLAAMVRSRLKADGWRLDDPQQSGSWPTAEQADASLRGKIAQRAVTMADDVAGQLWASGGEDVLIEREQAVLTARALRESCLVLRPVQRKVLALRFVSDMDQDEASRNLGFSASTVKREQARAFRHLRAHLAARGITSVPPWFEDEATDVLRAFLDEEDSG